MNFCIVYSKTTIPSRSLIFSLVSLKLPHLVKEVTWNFNLAGNPCCWVPLTPDVLRISGFLALGFFSRALRVVFKFESSVEIMESHSRLAILVGLKLCPNPVWMWNDREQKFCEVSKYLLLACLHRIFRILLIQRKGPNARTYIEKTGDLIHHEEEPVSCSQPHNASWVPTKCTPPNLERAMKPSRYEIAAQ